MNTTIHRLGLAALAFMWLAGCIRPRNYHPAGQPSTFHYRYKDDGSQGYGRQYFKNGSAYEAFVEFDARGSMYRDGKANPTQLDAAVNMIDKVRHPSGIDGAAQKIAVYVFVHGWKNNASEDSGNVWGFRRFLSDIAVSQCGVPVIGVYMGWPGASLKGDKFLTFWNREPVADSIGNSNDFEMALRRILHAAKGDARSKYDSEDRSVAVVIGHSFGGLVLEHAATALLREQLDTDPNTTSPADLFLLINEAGAAAIARPFLENLQAKGVTYNDQNQPPRPHPLMLSMTSTGDVATKFAYPGGEFFSFNRTQTETFSPPQFGQTSSLPFNLLTAANMIALQSHQIVRAGSQIPCDLAIPLSSTQSYCMNAIRENRLNNTPYWIMQLPQVFVPDHSAVFQDYLINLMEAVMDDARLTECRPSAPGGIKRLTEALAPTPPPPNRAGRPNMKRSQ